MYKNTLLKIYNKKTNKNKTFTSKMMITKIDVGKCTFSQVNLLTIKLAQYHLFYIIRLQIFGIFKILLKLYQSIIGSFSISVTISLSYFF